MEAEGSFEDQLAQAQQKRLEQRRRERAAARADIPAHTLAWLALPPDWTLHLADLCSFPCIGTHTVVETFARLVQAQLCTSQPGDEDPQYIVSEPTRTELCRQLSESNGLEWLLQEVCQIGKSLESCGGAELPPDIERWAALACQTQGLVTEAITQKLDEEVRRHLTLHQSGQALRWIVTARQFEDVLGDELTYAIQRASRRLDLFHRRSEDLRALTHFMERSHQIDAFKALLSGPEQQYMLHYIGDGGMGKTMLARYLNSVLADELHISSACIDFDYVNPDFPWRRPGLLLQELAVELRLQDEGDHSKSVATHFRRFDEKLVKEHERRSGWTVSNERFSLQAPGILEMLVPFVEALRALPRQPVVLILDTCEELAKLRPDGTFPASVAATFSLLQSLHQLLPTLRVVFCGRRPLVCGGKDSHMQTPDGLLIHEIRGFTHDEALRYLSEKMALPEALREPVIARSRMPVEQTEESRDPLYNPFDLALYASWVKEAYDEHQAGSEIALVKDLRGVSGDRYAEVRIVRRNPALAPLLPAVSLLGRFEKETLRAGLLQVSGDFEALFQELTQQEWLDRQQSAFYEVKRGLQPRLLAYYQQAEPALIERTRSTLLAHLAYVTLQRELSTLDISHFDVTLRLCAQEPERGARWWHAVEERVARTVSYHWFHPVCEFLLSDDGAAAAVHSPHTHRQEHPLRIAVLATSCAVLTHTEPQVSCGLLWREIEQKVESYPQAEERERLRLRALAGSFSSGFVARIPQAGLAKGETLLRALDRLQVEQVDEQLLASCAAAIEALLSASLQLLQQPPPGYAPLLRLVQWLVERQDVSRDLQSIFCLFAGRILAGSGQGKEARSWFRHAIQFASDQARQSWLDWLMPEHLAARVWLEYMTALYPAVLSAREMLAEIAVAPPLSVLALLRPGAGAIPAINTVDEDRLLAALLLLRGYVDQGSIAFLRSVFTYPSAGPFYQATCDVHRAYPPLFAALAGLMAENGLAGEAFAYLETCKREAERSASHPEMVAAADQALLLLLRRMRLRDEGWGLGIGTLLDPVSCELDGLDGLKVELSLPHMSTGQEVDELRRTQGADVVDRRLLQEIHQRWRSMYALDQERSQLIQDWFVEELAALPWKREWGVPFFAGMLDELEMRLLSMRQRSFRSGCALLSPEDMGWIWRWRRRQPVQVLTQLLRVCALSSSAEVPPSFVEQIGKRRAAAIALNEGELLALRLPSNATGLLQQAHTWFVETRDYGQALIASICLTLAYIRLGQSDEVASALEQARRDYQVFQPVIQDLVPAFPSLSRLASMDVRALDTLAPTGWRPWLVRFIVCLLWSASRVRGDVERSARQQSVLSWVQAHYGVSRDILRLPAELDGLFAREQSVQHAIPMPDAVQVTMTITLQDGGHKGQDVSVEEPVVVVLHVLNEREIILRDVRAIDAYAWAVARLAQAPDREIILGALHMQDRRSSAVPIVLQMVYETSCVCWEGIIAMALENSLPDWQRLRFHRILARRRSASADTWQKRHLLGLVGNSRQRLWLREAWEPLEDQRWTVEIAVGESLATLLERTAPRAVSCLHLVTNPVETAAGLRLQSRSIYHGARSAEVEVLQIEEIARKFAALQLCILQCPPQEGIERTSTERAQIGNLRLLAARLFAAGVSLVLTIPVLNLQQSVHVLDSLARALSEKEWRQALDQALIDARLFLLAESGDTSRERAFDFCLYTDE
jgi:hypothetical protein